MTRHRYSFFCCSGGDGNLGLLQRTILNGATCVILATLAGCGGGGGGSSAAPTETPTSAPTRTHTAPPPTETLQPTETSVPDTPTPRSTDTAVPTRTPTISPTSTPSPSPSPSPTHTFTPTPTPPVGPIVAAVGLADTNGTFDEPTGEDPSGRPIFGRQVGDGFLIYVEGRPGPSGLPVGDNILSSNRDDPAGRPDLQIVANRPLGDGSAEVCDKSFPDVGGVPAVTGVPFALDQPTSDAMNDLACRFRRYTEPDFACTQDRNGNFRFASLGTTLQFCSLINELDSFPAGDTVVTVRLRDTAGNVGPAVELVVRISGA